MASKKEEKKQLHEMTGLELATELYERTQAVHKALASQRSVINQIQWVEATKPDLTMTLKQLREAVFDFTMPLDDLDRDVARVLNTLKARFPKRAKSIDKICDRHCRVIELTSSSSRYDAAVERYTDFIYWLTE